MQIEHKKPAMVNSNTYCTNHCTPQGVYVWKRNNEWFMPQYYWLNASLPTKTSYISLDSGNGYTMLNALLDDIRLDIMQACRHCDYAYIILEHPSIENSHISQFSSSELSIMRDAGFTILSSYYDYINIHPYKPSGKIQHIPQSDLPSSSVQQN